MIGKSLPLIGAETRNCNSDARPGTEKTIGLKERNGVGALTGI